MKVPDTNKLISIMYLIGMLIILFVVYKVLTGLGLIKTAAKKQKEKNEVKAEEALRTTEYFNPDTLLRFPNYKSLPNIKDITKQVRAALRGFGTDEEQIFTAFGRLKNKLNVAELALTFKAEHNKDLATELLNDLTDSEQVTLMDIINKLPNK